MADVVEDASVVDIVLSFGPSLRETSQGLILYLNLFVVVILSIFVLANAPRAYARFSQTSEWAQGFFLWSAPSQSRKPTRQPSTRSIPVSTKNGAKQDRVVVPAQGEKHGPSPPKLSSFPRHVPAHPAFLRDAASILRRPSIWPGLPLGRIALFSIYMGILTYGGFYRSDPVRDPDRIGFVSVSQIPLVFALATKNNMIGFTNGIGYERLNFVHRFAGRLVTVAANIHALSYIYLYAAEGTLSTRLRVPRMAWGFAALACLDALAIFSTSMWRLKAYRFFFNTHIVAFLVLLPAICFHNRKLFPYALAATGIYALDHIIRLFKSRVAIASIQPIPELDVTRVDVPTLNAGWRAGQHVRLRVLSFEMGWFSWMEVHPFTIASISNGPGGLVLLCKRTGDWTGSLYEMAKLAGYADEEGGLGKGVKRLVRVVVEGPYGGPGFTLFSSYSAAIFAVGGSGITFALSAIQDLIQKDRGGGSRVKVIELVWMIRDASSLAPFYPLFCSLVEQSTKSPLRISVHYTRASKTATPMEGTAPGVSLNPGRPRLSKVLDTVMTRVVTLGSGEKDEEAPCGVFVGVCGPPGLRDEVAGVIREVDSGRRDRVGGVDVYEEVFGW